MTRRKLKKTPIPLPALGNHKLTEIRNQTQALPRQTLCALPPHMLRNTLLLTGWHKLFLNTGQLILRFHEDWEDNAIFSFIFVAFTR